MPTITRTEEVTISLTIEEIAQAFAGMFGDEQAKFFAIVHEIAKPWPGAGWCQQSYDIAKNLTYEGREVIRTLASHALDRDDI